MLAQSLTGAAEKGGKGKAVTVADVMEFIEDGGELFFVGCIFVVAAVTGPHAWPLSPSPTLVYSTEILRMYVAQPDLTLGVWPGSVLTAIAVGSVLVESRRTREKPHVDKALVEIQKACPYCRGSCRRSCV